MKVFICIQVESGGKTTQNCATVRVSHPLDVQSGNCRCYRTKKMRYLYSNSATVQNLYRETFKLGYCLFLVNYSFINPSYSQQR